MRDIHPPGRALSELDLANIVIVIEPRPIRWDLWVTFAAAVLAILVVAGVLLTLTAELRAGWVPGHELPMDKAAAIHKLLFRP
jgi:hypothetical protein